MRIEPISEGPESSAAGQKLRISIVVPCLNEEEVLPEFFRRVTEAANAWECEWEAICIDDGSGDGTWRQLSDQSQRDPRWKVLSFARNFGHQAAVSAGLF